MSIASPPLPFPDHVGEASSLVYSWAQPGLAGYDELDASTFEVRSCSLAPRSRAAYSCSTHRGARRGKGRDMLLAYAIPIVDLARGILLASLCLGSFDTFCVGGGHIVVFVLRTLLLKRSPLIKLKGLLGGDPTTLVVPAYTLGYPGSTYNFEASVSSGPSGPTSSTFIEVRRKGNSCPYSSP